jgi:hypothetical protein
VKIGPFLDSGDGYTAETGLTISQADVRLSKNGGNMAQKSDSTACTHDEVGYYDCPLNTTDTNTLGRLQLMVAESGALPVFHDFMVVTANVYDTLCSTDSFDVNLNASQAGVTVGTVTTLTNKTGFSLAADQSAVTIGEVDQVNDKTGYALSDAGVDGIWDEALSGHTTAGTSGLTLANILRVGKNKWAYTGTTFTIYADNGTDALYQFTLDDAETPTSRTPV